MKKYFYLATICLTLFSSAAMATGTGGKNLPPEPSLLQKVIKMLSSENVEPAPHDKKSN